LTARLRLSQDIARGYSGRPETRLHSDLFEPVIAGPPERRPLFFSPPAYWAGGRGACLLLTPSVATCACPHGFTRVAERRSPDPPPPPPRQRRRLHRTRVPSIGDNPSSTSLFSRDPLAQTCSCEASGELPPDFCNRLRSASTTSNRPNPGARGCRVTPSLAGRCQPRVFESGTQIRGFRRTGRRRRARPKPGAVDGETPTRFDSDTFCRKSVSSALERRKPRLALLGAPFTNLPELPALTRFRGCLRKPNELAFAKPAARLPACAGRLALRAASRSPPRRGARSAAPKVPSIARMPAGLSGAIPGITRVVPPDGSRSVRPKPPRSVETTSQLASLFSTGCSQPVEIGRVPLQPRLRRRPSDERGER
jgi:hypothetical protein